MGMFSKLFGGSKKTYVRVAFRALDRDLGSHHPEGYAYEWTLPEKPEIGMRVIVPGMDGPAPAIVMGLGEGGIPHEVKRVIRLVTDAEIEAAHGKTEAARTKWFEMARRAAGLASTSRARVIPEGFPEIPPVDGEASSEEADRYGRGWWKIAKRAEEAGRDPEELKRFRSIAHRWFAIRDRQR